MALYKVLESFEFDGLSYVEGEKYEFADEVIPNLPTEKIELAEGLDSTAPTSSEEEAETPAPSEEGDSETPEAGAEDAPGWVGGHTVGRE